MLNLTAQLLEVVFFLRWRLVTRLLVLPHVSRLNPINSVVMQTLRSWQEQKHAGKNSLYVFPSPVTGEKLDNVNKSWARVLKDAEIKNFRWHDMRHDFASQLVMKGVDLNTVRELMGHSDMKMTMRYAHLAPCSKLRAVELLVENAL